MHRFNQLNHLNLRLNQSRVTSFPLAVSGGGRRNMDGIIGGRVTGGGGRRISFSVSDLGDLLIGRRLLVIREIVQTHTLPHRIDNDSNSEQHDLSLLRGAGAGATTTASCLRRATHGGHLNAFFRFCPLRLFWFFITTTTFNLFRTVQIRGRGVSGSGASLMFIFINVSRSHVARF